MQCFKYKQTWSFVVGKFFTDGVWWFYLFWAPAYFSDQFGYESSSTMGMALIFVLYLIVTILSIYGGYLPKLFVEKKGMGPYAGRMRAMLIFAFFRCSRCSLSAWCKFSHGSPQSSSVLPVQVIRLGLPTCSLQSVICSPNQLSQPLQV